MSHTPIPGLIVKAQGMLKTNVELAEDRPEDHV